MSDHYDYNAPPPGSHLLDEEISGPAQDAERERVAEEMEQNAEQERVAEEMEQNAEQERAAEDLLDRERAAEDATELEPGAEASEDASDGQPNIKISMQSRLRPKFPENPWRPFSIKKKTGEKTQTLGWRSYQIILDNPGLTIKEFLEKGGRYRDVPWDYNLGRLEITLPDGRVISRDADMLPRLQKTEGEAPKRKPGRPRKAKAAEASEGGEDAPKRKPGRPRRAKAAEAGDAPADAATASNENGEGFPDPLAAVGGEPAPIKRRGRKKKAEIPVETSDTETATVSGTEPDGPAAETVPEEGFISGA